MGTRPGPPWWCGASTARSTNAGTGAVSRSRRLQGSIGRVQERTTPHGHETEADWRIEKAGQEHQGEAASQAGEAGRPEAGSKGLGNQVVQPGGCPLPPQLMTLGSGFPFLFDGLMERLEPLPGHDDIRGDVGRDEV